MDGCRAPSGRDRAITASSLATGRRRRSTALAGAAALCLTLSACSDSDTDDPSDSSAAPTATVAPETAPRAPSADTDQVTSTAGPSAGEGAAQIAQVPAQEVNPARISDIADRAEAEFDIPTADWLADAFGSIWVKRNDGQLDRIDPWSNTVVASIEIHDQGDECTGIGGTPEQLWVCSADGSIASIDPWNNIVSYTVEVDKIFEQATLPIAFDHVWVLTGEGETLTGVSLWTGAIDVEFDLPSTCAEVAASIDALWVACPEDGVVLKLDPADGSELARAEDLPGTRNLSIGTAVYAGFSGGTARIDPATAVVTGAVNIGPGSSAGEVEASGGVVWLRAEGTFLRSFDARSLVFAEEIAAPETSGGDVLVAYGSVWASAYTEGIVYRLPPLPFSSASG